MSLLPKCSKYDPDTKRNHYIDNSFNLTNPYSTIFTPNPLSPTPLIPVQQTLSSFIPLSPLSSSRLHTNHLPDFSFNLNIATYNIQGFNNPEKKLLMEEY
ncbi:3163_t:CDS:2, partial [Cetraspora pellucida]